MAPVFPLQMPAQDVAIIWAPQGMMVEMVRRLRAAPQPNYQQTLTTGPGPPDTMRTS